MEAPFVSQQPQARNTKKIAAVALLAVFAISAVFALSSVTASTESSDLIQVNDIATIWKQWKQVHGKVYGVAEEAIRFQAFIDMYNFIERHNANPEHSYQLGLNQFSDLESHEWAALVDGLVVPPKQDEQEAAAFEASPAAATTLPTSLDWRTKGYVNAIQNQGSCGSCWAHAAVATMEGLAFKKTGKLPLLSRQQLVDCSGSYGNLGCNGGWCQNAFKYAMAKGMANDTIYNYTGVTGTVCKSFTSIFKPTNYVQVQAKNLTALLVALQNGPVVVYIEASAKSFQSYKSGIYNDPACWSAKAINHAVVAVGYNATSLYIRNSWGTWWGASGYVYLSNVNATTSGVCGVFSNSNTYPTA